MTMVERQRHDDPVTGTARADLDTRWWRRRWWRDRRWAAAIGWFTGHRVGLTICTSYLLLAGYVTSGLWRHPDRMTVAGNDQILFEWMLARAARAVVGLENPLYSNQLNAPDGVNLMANTSVLGLGIPLTPVTLWFGSRTALLVAMVLSFAGTAGAWYVLLRRRFGAAAPAAAIGGLWCGFAPGMISQGIAHLHMIAQFLVPAILWIVFHPGTDRVLRHGVLLGLLVTYQVFIGEEVLTFLALACGLFTVAYAVCAPAAARRLARPFIARLAIGAGVSVPLLAYPLWYQFYGPGHYRGLPFEPRAYALDLASYFTSARQSIAGHESVAALLAPNPTEESSFFGLPLIAICAVVVLWQWRDPLIRALAGCALLFAALSLGERIRFNGEPTGLPGPYRLIADLPPLDLAVPARLSLVCVPIMAILLTRSIDLVFRRSAGVRASAQPPARDGVDSLSRVDPPAASPEQPRLPVRLLWTGAVFAALLPALPMPMRTVPVWPVPEFVASGQWRSYVPPERTLVPVPPTMGTEATAGMYWSARAMLAFSVPGGYFIGPRDARDQQARWGSPERPTAVLLERVARTGEIPIITDRERQQAIADLRAWRAAIVVQGALHRGEPVRRTVELLLGPAQHIAGAWVWDVRDRVG